ncbi:MAG: hypothetical protein IPG46_00570 [Actinobacteria bacterium]|nr:hypothetical protein [Actinomycetota bacterium]
MTSDTDPTDPHETPDTTTLDPSVVARVRATLADIPTDDALRERHIAAALDAFDEANAADAPPVAPHDVEEATAVNVLTIAPTRRRLAWRAVAVAAAIVALAGVGVGVRVGDRVETTASNDASFESVSSGESSTERSSGDQAVAEPAAGSSQTASGSAPPSESAASGLGAAPSGSDAETRVNKSVVDPSASGGLPTVATMDELRALLPGLRSTATQTVPVPDGADSSESDTAGWSTTCDLGAFNGRLVAGVVVAGRPVVVIFPSDPGAPGATVIDSTTCAPTSL